MLKHATVQIEKAFKNPLKFRLSNNETLIV